MSEASVTLRRLLSEKFPGLRTDLSGRSPKVKDFWPVDLSSCHIAWPRQFAKGVVTEIICGGNYSGSASLIHALIHCAAVEKQIIAVIDGTDCLDVLSMAPRDLSRLLWVRCQVAADALKSADLLLRDNNFSMVLVDLKFNPESELRKIPAMTWYRMQRLVENAATVCLVLTPRMLVNATRHRFNLPGLDRSCLRP